MIHNEEIERFSTADDFYVSPYYRDGTTSGTPTWIWSVVVEKAIYIRAWNGQNSRWFKSAINQGKGQIQIDGHKYDATFKHIPVIENASLIQKIDNAYKNKYQGSVYMPPMISESPRNAIVRIDIQR